MQSWKTISRRVILNHSKFLTVEDHTVELPEDRVISKWPWVITPDYVNVAVLTEDGEFLCFRQTKYAVEGVSLAPVGGYLDPGEAPLAAAQRELLEETGYESSQWSLAAKGPSSPGLSTEILTFFLAADAVRVGPGGGDASEKIEVHVVPLAEVDDWLRARQQAGSLIDAKIHAGLHFASRIR